MKLLTLIIVLSACLLSNAQTTNVPYSNYFDNWPTDTLGWSHSAQSGTDDWEVGDPNNGSYFSNSYSLPYAWKTNLNGDYAANSDRSLETPYFNLTSTAQNMVFSIKHKVLAAGSSYFTIEYRVGANGTWQHLDDPSTDKENWQGSSGFGDYYSQWRTSSIDISFIQGQDSVKFRFRFESDYSNGGGWLIDDFSIQPEYYNLAALQGDTIRGINSFFDEFTVVSEFHFDNQWGEFYPFTNRFYFSHDDALDAGDQFLGEVNFTTSSSITNFDNTFSLPAGLSPGEYYVFYEYDVLDTVTENNESDNINYTVLVIDSMYTTDYVEDFDTTALIWNSMYGASDSQWDKGDPDNWHVEDPRSGNNAWLSGQQSYNENYLTSPYFDLSGSTNTSICWWYKSSKSYGTPNFYLQKPSYGNTTIGHPYYYSVNNTTYNTRIRAARYYGWDCYCEELPEYDGEQSTQFRFLAHGNTTPNSMNQVLIDELYIGAKKSDVGIGGERDNRYTSSFLTTDTLTYLLFNSGLDQLPPTNTEFYWSNDSILDGSDILLGSQVEPSIMDTTFISREFEYIKPTTSEGEYFIIYVLDAGDIVDEMREYDNVGYFRINQTYQASLPYLNDFESDIQGWRHTATLGEDEWEWDIPSGTILDTAFSGQKAFCTNADDTVAFKSRMHLFSPVFDLTELNQPVIEFDLFNYFYGYGYNLWPFNMGNMMYSTDGGNSWKLLYASTNSQKNWYSRIEFQYISGKDQINNFFNSNGELLYMRQSPIFSDHRRYQGRDYDDNTHFVFDLDFLKNEDQIQFMFVYANHDAPVEGMLLDNFEIKESQKDLKVESTKKLMVSSADKQLKTFFHVKNDANYLSDTSDINIYLSSDSLLDANDEFLHTQSLPGLRPFQKHLINLVLDVPVNYGQYNYLIYELDPNDLVQEINEQNNIGYLDLAMDSSINYNYPILFDFDGDEVDGWTWWHDSTGSYHGHRFRHDNIDYYINDHEDGTWYLDPIDLAGYGFNYYSFPIFHLEPPAFDFSELSVIEMTFDFISVGKYNFDSQGGNMSFSTDGGDTWTVLDGSYDIYAQNWYDFSEIESLNDEPGWVDFHDWTTAKFNLSFLAGEPNVRFRFNFRSEHVSNSLSVHGFRLDDFEIDGEFNDLIASQVHDTISINSSFQPSFSMEYEIENNGLGEIMNSRTLFYWSTDTLLDAGDSLLYQVPESIFNANTVVTDSQTIYYPTPIVLPEYYILYHTDGDSTIHESNESNNVGWWKVNFTDSMFVDLQSVPNISPVYTDVLSDWFYFEFDFENNGTIPSDSALVSVHWSTDTLLDGGDVLLYDIEEPGLASSSYISHQGNVYFPHPILQEQYYLLISTDVNNDNTESDESNNFAWVEVNVDTTGLGVPNESVLEEFSFSPGDEFLRLTYTGENSGEMSISIINSLGQEIVKEEANIDPDQTFKVRRPNLKPGVYYFRVKKGSSYNVFKFIGL